MRPFLLFLTLLVTTALAAQTNTFSGTVVDATGDLLIGVNVSATPADVRTVTDFNGRFRFEAAADSLVVAFDYTGYTTVTQTLYAGRSASIKMEDNAAMLEEVVVIGYETTYKSDVTGSVGAVAAGRVAEHAAPPPPPVTAKKMSFDVASTPAPTNRPAAGQLTATEINDFGKWELWTDISRAELDAHRSAWPIFPDHRYTVQLTDAAGQPVTDRKVYLETADGKVQWTARTDNQGRAELWYGAWTETGEHQTALFVRTAATAAEKSARQPARPFTDGITTLRLTGPCTRVPAADVAFVVDATGSMGDELRFLASELTDVMDRARSELAATDLRLGAVYYRDHGEEYLTRHQDFTADTTIFDFIRAQRANGGGDQPEAVTDALATALDSLNWRDNAARLLFLVLDAPPHREKQERLWELTKQAAARGVRIIPVVCSGMAPDGEYLFRSIALATNGTAVFLTDDSGIGGTHLKPVTDKTEVEALNDLLVRIIVAGADVPACGSVVATPQPKPTDSDEAADWKVFPNPTSGPITVRLPKGKGELFILDTSGKLLARRKVTEKRFDHDLTGLPAGNYLLRYRGKDSVSGRWVSLVK